MVSWETGGVALVTEGATVKNSLPEAKKEYADSWDMNPLLAVGGQQATRGLR